MQKKLEALPTNQENFITLKNAKQYLRIEHDHDNEMIENLIEISTIAAENYLGLQLKYSRWKMVLPKGSYSEIKLTHSSINEIEQFKIIKFNGDFVDLSIEQYFWDKNSNSIKLLHQYNVEKAEVIYSAGYIPCSLPSPIKQGMLEHLARLYDVRGSDYGIPVAAKSLYQPYKIIRL